MHLSVNCKTSIALISVERQESWCAYYLIDGTRDPWLYTSGFEGPARFELTLSHQEAREYRVRLHFAEPQDATPGERVYDVMIQGKTVLSDLDIAKEAGGARWIMVKEIAGFSATETTEIQLSSIRGKPPLLCSLEMIEQ